MEWRKKRKNEPKTFLIGNINKRKRKPEKPSCPGAGLDDKPQNPTASLNSPHWPFSLLHLPHSLLPSSLPRTPTASSWEVGLVNQIRHCDWGVEVVFGEMKKKSSLQLEALESLYADVKYPTNDQMEEYASAFGLTLKQVRGWFIEKRRRDKGTYGMQSCGKCDAPRGISARKNLKRRAGHNNKTNVWGVKEKKKMNNFQNLLSPGYILSKLFRKDGPPLGIEFDFVPSRAFSKYKASQDYHADEESQRRPTKRKKVAGCSVIDHQSRENVQMKKHGMGKGLMTVWRVVNPGGGDLPTGIVSADATMNIVQVPDSTGRRPPTRNRRRQPLISLMKKKRLEKKSKETKRLWSRRKQVGSKKEDDHKQSCREKCELAVEDIVSECHDKYSMLVDDEELELRELQAGKSPLTCSDHIGTSGLLGCSLCKDLLPKFPPNSVQMKQPFGTQPWDSSPETVKNFFKVLHFLYTYSVVINICPFTLDEFAQAFHDKDSMLIGKIHVALLKLLLSDVEVELSGRTWPHLGVSCKFLALIQSVENQEHVLEFWKNSLNAMTWTEILRQVLVAAGFGSKRGPLRAESVSREMRLMEKYGLRLGTLKGELFKILSEQGNKGLKVSDMAKSSPIIELNFGGTAEELEQLICSTLSSDITLFEKIASSAYRLRISCVTEKAHEFESDTDESGSVDDDSSDNSACSSSDESECISETSSQRKMRNKITQKSRNNIVTVYGEIDESHQGEVWLLELMEGEYSDLSIEEKLSAFVALIDILSAGSSIRMKYPTKALVERMPNIPRGSGAKIKRASLNQDRPSWVHYGHKDLQELPASSDAHPVDSSSISKFWLEQKSSDQEDAKTTEGLFYLHPMQSVFLGSDRRYNRYWLFLGPCNEYDPGHTRIYFESSEDGHWEVLDTQEALRALLSGLDDRGRREAVLIESLEKREQFLCEAISVRQRNDASGGKMHSDLSELANGRENSASPVSDIDNNITLIDVLTVSPSPSGAIVLEVGKRGDEQKCKWKRLQQFDLWLWDCFYTNLNAVQHSKRPFQESLTRCEGCNDLFWRYEKHCKICHVTFEVDFDLEERYAVHAATCREKAGRECIPNYKVRSSQLQSMKAAIHAIESVVPEDALMGAWTRSAHRLWVKRLRRTSSLSELFQVLADFVAAFNEDWLNQCSSVKVSYNTIEETVACFPVIPQTSSALALWLIKLDTSIAPFLEDVQPAKE